MSLAYSYFAILGGFAILCIWFFVKDIRGIIEQINSFKWVKEDRKLKNKCEKHLKDAKLIKFDEMYEDVRPDKLDAFNVSKTVKKKDYISDDLRVLLNTYDKDRFTFIKMEMSKLKEGYLKELSIATYKDIKALRCRLYDVDLELRGLVNHLALSTELENLKSYNKVDLSTEGNEKLIKHINGRLDSLIAIKSYIFNTLKSEYKLKIDELALLNYDILKYNEYTSGKLVDADLSIIMGKVIKLCEDLQFKVEVLEANIINIYSDISFMNYMVYLSLDRLQKGVITKATVEMEELERLEKLAEDKLKSNYKITFLTNRNFSQEAYNYIIDTYKIECLTIGRLLELPLLKDEDIQYSRKGLINELYVRKEKLLNTNNESKVG